MKRSFYFFAICISQLLFTVHAQDFQCPVNQPPYQKNLPLPPHEENYYPTSRGTIYYQYYHSKPGPLVILIPGLSSVIAYADLIVRLTDADFNVLAFDYPGKMNSKVSEKEDLNFILTQVTQLLAGKKILQHQKWHIVGNSMGAMLASTLAVKYHQWVKSLTFLNPVGFEQNWSLSERMALIPVLSQMGAPFVIKKLVKANISKNLICPGNYQNFINEQDQFLETVENKWNYLNLIANYGMVPRPDVFAKLKGARFPILVTSGQAGLDRLQGQVDQMRKVLPEAQYEQIPATSHLPFIENPEATFTTLMNFISDSE